MLKEQEDARKNGKVLKFYLYQSLKWEWYDFCLLWNRNIIGKLKGKRNVNRDRKANKNNEEYKWAHDSHLNCN